MATDRSTLNGQDDLVPLYAIGDQEPTIDPTAFIHPDAVIIGSVTVGAQSSVWPGAVLRGDHGWISVGARTSIQDGTVIHCTPVHPTIVGDDCVIGHLVHLEGCTIENFALVGSGSVVLHGAIVRTQALVGAGAVVSNGKEVPTGAQALGIPAKIRLDSVTPQMISTGRDLYINNAAWYAKDLRRLD